MTDDAITDGPTSTAATPEPTTSATDQSVPPTAPTARPRPTADDVVGAAIADLGSRLGVAPGDITVTKNEEVTWRDGSLGCAEKGMAYITMLVAGHLVVLEAGGKAYEYHAGRGKAPFLCENPQPPLPAGSAGS